MSANVIEWYFGVKSAPKEKQRGDGLQGTGGVAKKARNVMRNKVNWDKQTGLLVPLTKSTARRAKPGSDPNAALALRLLSCMNDEDEDEGEIDERERAEKHQACVEALTRTLMDYKNDFDESTLRTYLTKYSGYGPDVIDIYMSEALQKSRESREATARTLGMNSLEDMFQRTI